MEIFIKGNCPYCLRLLRLLERTDMTYEVHDVLEEKMYYDQMIMLSRDGGVPQVKLENVIIYDYDTESTLVDDIKKIMEHGPVDAQWMDDNTAKTRYVIMKT